MGSRRPPHPTAAPMRAHTPLPPPLGSPANSRAGGATRPASPAATAPAAASRATVLGQAAAPTRCPPPTAELHGAEAAFQPAAAAPAFRQGLSQSTHTLGAYEANMALLPLGQQQPTTGPSLQRSAHLQLPAGPSTAAGTSSRRQAACQLSTALHHQGQQQPPQRQQQQPQPPHQQPPSLEYDPLSAAGEQHDAATGASRAARGHAGASTTLPPTPQPGLPPLPANLPSPAALIANPSAGGPASPLPMGGSDGKAISAEALLASIKEQVARMMALSGRGMGAAAPTVDAQQATGDFAAMAAAAPQPTGTSAAAAAAAQGVPKPQCTRGPPSTSTPAAAAGQLAMPPLCSLAASPQRHPKGTEPPPVLPTPATQPVSAAAASAAVLAQQGEGQGPVPPAAVPVNAAQVGSAAARVPSPAPAKQPGQAAGSSRGILPCGQSRPPLRQQMKD